MERLSEDVHRAIFGAMGTTCRVTFSSPTGAAARDFSGRVRAWVETFEASCSRFRSDSDISRINHAAGEWVAIDGELEGLLALCDVFYWRTEGVFDPTSLALTRLWAASRDVLPDDAAIAAARQLTNWRDVQREPDRVRLRQAGMALDLGGIGKEYAADRVADLGREIGLRSMLVDFGQDIRTFGPSPQEEAWRVGLEDPHRPGSCWSGVALRDAAVATSGNYYRGFQSGDRRLGHILDPRTGRPADTDCLSVSVIAPTCTEAGILSKTVMILGAETGIAFLRRFPAVQGCAVTTRDVYQTSRFAAYALDIHAH
jgi:thiamine biosynthesis lipoprotein